MLSLSLDIDWPTLYPGESTISLLLCLVELPESLSYSPSETLMNPSVFHIDEVSTVSAFVSSVIHE